MGCTTSRESTSMQYKLKQLYKQLTIPQAAWMEHSMESSIQDFYFDLNLLSNQVMLNHNQLFDDLTTKRILVEGLPGYGKTTLVTKIAYDWSRNEQYLQRFDLVFLVKIRELQDMSVNEAIVHLVKIAGYEPADEVLEKIEKEEDKILLLLDGLDEVTPNVRDKILRILYKKEMRRMTVVVTCRSGEFNLKPDEGRTLFRGLPIKREFCDKHITVLGIHEKQKTEFLKKFLHETESVNNVIEHLKNMTATAQNLFESPLMLILLADMVVRGETIGPVTSKTRFYKDVINFMIRRSEERRNIYLTPSFTVFDARNTENNLFKVALKQFGHLCFQQVWSGNQLEFDDNELIRSVHKLGLLIIQKKMSNTRCKIFYQIYHRTIMEFMTAYYIFEDFLSNNLLFSNDIEHKLIEDIIDFGSSSMVTPFLIGLMRDKACHYFNLMSTKYTDAVPYYPTTLWQMLMECECIDQIEDSLIPNLPSYIHQVNPGRTHFYSSDLHKHLVKLGTQSGRIKHVMLEPTYRPSLPMDIELPNVSILISKRTRDDDIFHILPQIPYKRCNMILSDFPYDKNHFTHSFKILMSIPSKLYTLEIGNEDAINLMQVKEELDKNILIDKLTYQPIPTFHSKDAQRLMFEGICNVLDRFHINLFSLIVEDGRDAIQLLSHCTKVDRLDLTCKKMSSISMDAIFLDKQWESVRLGNIKLTLPATKEFYACKIFRFFGMSEKTVLSKISGVTHLECWASTLNELMQDPSWPCQTLTKIRLLMNLCSYKFWENFKLFPNLQLLQMENWPYCMYTSNDADILPNILQLPIPKLIVGFRDHFDDELSFIHHLSNSLQKLTITSLKILVITMKYDECPAKIKHDLVLKCADILKICSEKNMSLKTIELHLPIKNEGNFDIDHFCNLSVKFSFEERGFIFVAMSNR